MHPRSLCCILIQVLKGSDIPDPTFSGHEGFALRFSWLPKAVQVTQQEKEFFSREDALVELGVGKNMVRSIRFWGVATGLLHEVRVPGERRSNGVLPTALGLLLFGSDGLDPFLEDPATLWLVHWQLASRPEAPTTWYWAFNDYSDGEFTKAKLKASLSHFIERSDWGRSFAESSLDRDVDCFIRTYVPSRRSKGESLEDSLDSPLTELSLIQELDGFSGFSFSRTERPSLPLAIFAYTLVAFWEVNAPLVRTMTFDQVAYRSGSPGRVFRLSETALVDLLERLESFTRGAISYGVTAGLRQVYRRELKPNYGIEILRKHYRRV